MNEQLLKARAAFEDAQAAYDNEPDSDAALDKLLDVVAILLSEAERKEGQPPEIVDIPPPPAEPTPVHALPIDNELQQAIRSQQRMIRAVPPSYDPYWETAQRLWLIQTRMRPDCSVEAIPSGPPSVRAYRQDGETFAVSIPAPPIPTNSAGVAPTINPYSY